MPRRKRKVRLYVSYYELRQKGACPASLETFKDVFGLFAICDWCHETQELLEQVFSKGDVAWFIRIFGLWDWFKEEFGEPFTHGGIPFFPDEIPF